MACKQYRMLSHADYTVACICPMGVELAPVEGMLDETQKSTKSTLNSLITENGE